MSVLMVNEYADFNTLKELLGATDGNLASHSKSLEKVIAVSSTQPEAVHWLVLKWMLLLVEESEPSSN